MSRKVSESDLRAAKISESTVRRLSVYLRLLQEVEGNGQETISSEDLAERAGTTAAQVRKDLSSFGSFGKRGLGYSVAELLRTLREILGLNRRWRVALVGAGKIGSALISYRNFRRRGFEIEAVFDSDAAKVGRKWGESEILDDGLLEHELRKREIDIVVIAVPADAAQGVAERVVSAGVTAILNFAPVRLRVPPPVVVRNVDMVVEMASLAFALNNR